MTVTYKPTAIVIGFLIYILVNATSNNTAAAIIAGIAAAAVGWIAIGLLESVLTAAANKADDALRKGVKAAKQKYEQNKQASAQSARPAQSTATQATQPAPTRPIATQPVAAKFCSRCGAPLNPGAAFCGKCGNKLG